MKLPEVIIGKVLLLAGVIGCGQQSLFIPESPTVGMCGDWYPGGAADDADAGEQYAIETGKTFPCIVFESARLARNDTYINIPDEYLKAKHGHAQTRSIVIVIGASNCPGCAVLIEEMASLSDEFEAAGALMIGAAWCNNMDVDDCDFDINEAELILRSEGWPTEKWLITNDEESHLRPNYSDVFPSVIVVKIEDMSVQAVEIAPEASTILSLVKVL